MRSVLSISLLMTVLHFVDCASCGFDSVSSRTFHYIKGATDLKINLVKSEITEFGDTVCAAKCTALFDSSLGCTAFVTDGNNCSMFLIQKEALTNPGINQTEIYFNNDLIDSLVNYRFLHILTDFTLHGVGIGKGRGVSCTSSSINNLKNILPPSGFTSVSFNGYGIALKTSTLLVCGGKNSGSGAQSNQCFFCQLGSTNPAWNTSVKLSKAKFAPTAIGMKEKIYITGGETAGLKSTSIEVFDSVNLTMTMVPNVLISPGFSTGTCTIALLDEESIVFIGGTYPIAPYSGTMVVDKSVAIFDTKDNTWQKLQDLPSPRSYHGCGRVTSTTKTYFVVYGGSDGTSNLASVILYNRKQNIWETPPSYVKLPAAFSGIRNAVVLQMDEYGCNMMFMELTTYHLQICSGNFTWKSASVPYDASAGGFTLGANDLLPCGIY